MWWVSLGAMGMTPLWRSESMTLSLHGLVRDFTTCPCHGIDGLLMLEVGSSTFTLKTQFPEYCTLLVEAAKLILRSAIWCREKLSCCPYYQRGYNSYRYHTFPGKKKKLIGMHSMHPQGWGPLFKHLPWAGKRWVFWEFIFVCHFHVAYIRISCNGAF